MVDSLKQKSTSIRLGDWYCDNDGLLYIVDMKKTVHGPDNDTTERLREVVNGTSGRSASYSATKDLGLEYIQPSARRFNEETGYYFEKGSRRIL